MSALSKARYQDARGKRQVAKSQKNRSSGTAGNERIIMLIRTKAMIKQTDSSKTPLSGRYGELAGVDGSR